MKTSEIIKLFDDVESVQNFCATNAIEKKRVIERRDGAQTSGDLGLVFDLIEDTCVTELQIHTLLNFFLRNQTDLNDVKFLATVILLCGFDFSSEESEQNFLLLAEEVDVSNYMQEIRRMLASA